MTDVICLKARRKSVLRRIGLMVAWNDKVERERARRATQGPWIGGIKVAALRSGSKTHSRELKKSIKLIVRAKRYSRAGFLCMRRGH
ncbi:hypothetical protein ACQR10_17930 [Bradyrhizobium sp. HKCCYLRH2060]|uniref:hypothetical protein n=1 Tax=Bradyrhizobium sp. HKCCYLRH2060 TaxID=3420743 RepID=UPI003EBD0AFC